jgi:predicted nucleic acid-binding protein
MTFSACAWKRLDAGVPRDAADPDRRDAVAEWHALAVADIDTTSVVEAIAEEIAARGVRPMDALPVASAIAAGANWLLTTDQGLLKKMQGDSRIRVADPIDFIRALAETEALVQFGF